MCQDVYSSSRRRNTQPDVSIYQCVSVCNTNTQNALWLLILLWAMRTTLYTLFVEMHANDAKSVKSKLAADSVPKRERKTLLIRRWSMFWWRLWFCARHKNRIKETFFFLWIGIHSKFFWALYYLSISRSISGLMAAWCRKALFEQAISNQLRNYYAVVLLFMSISAFSY